MKLKCHCLPTPTAGVFPPISAHGWDLMEMGNVKKENLKNSRLKSFLFENLFIKWG